MNAQLAARLEYHQQDFARCTGKPFRHFHCPILHVDEPIDLQRGHIINEAFEGSPKKWVVQRTDVDSFYGRYFEADFETIQYGPKLTKFLLFSDKKIYQRYKPRVVVGEQEFQYFPYFGGKIPKGYTVAPVTEGDRTFSLCVKAAPEQIFDEANPWCARIDSDFRVYANISLIKAAHLSMFSMLGYTYALSSAGVFVGYDILGKFFRQNQTADIKKLPGTVRKRMIQNNALTYFREFQHMVLPLSPECVGLEGTFVDGEVSLCSGVNGDPWGMIVFVKTAKLVSAVLLPFPGNPDASFRFVSFLAGESEELHIMKARIEIDDSGRPRWRFNPNKTPLHWPKSGGFPHKLD